MKETLNIDRDLKTISFNQGNLASKEVNLRDRGFDQPFGAMLDLLGFDTYGAHNDSVYSGSHLEYEDDLMIVRTFDYSDDIVNFEFKGSDEVDKYSISWYKYPLRSAYISREISYKEFYRSLEVILERNNIPKACLEERMRLYNERTITYQVSNNDLVLIKVLLSDGYQLKLKNNPFDGIGHGCNIILRSYIDVLSKEFIEVVNLIDSAKMYVSNSLRDKINNINVSEIDLETNFDEIDFMNEENYDQIMKEIKCRVNIIGDFINVSDILDSDSINLELKVLAINEDSILVNKVNK